METVGPAGQLWVDGRRGVAGVGDRELPLTPLDVAVLAALASAGGRVVSRAELARRAGLAGRSARRSDSVLVRLRRVLGPDALRNVRSRGWSLARPVLTIDAAEGLDRTA